MKKPLFYAMDTGFYPPNSGYPIPLRYEILAELGYDAAYLTLWHLEPWTTTTLRAVDTLGALGLPTCAVYTGTGAPPENVAKERSRLIDLLERTPAGCDIELAVGAPKPYGKSDPAADAVFLDFMGPVIDAAERLGKRIVLYPHNGCWLERVEDATRLCAQASRAGLRAAFCGYHWWMVDGKGGELKAKLTAAAPWLGAVNLTGSRLPEPGGRPPFEPLDSGTLDNYAIYSLIRSLGYDGRIGVQAFKVGGDVMEHYRRSLQTLRRWEERHAKHPEWADMIIHQG